MQHIRFEGVRHACPVGQPTGSAKQEHETNCKWHRQHMNHKTGKTLLSYLILKHGRVQSNQPQVQFLQFHNLRNPCSDGTDLRIRQGQTWRTLKCIDDMWRVCTKISCVFMKIANQSAEISFLQIVDTILVSFCLIFVLAWPT